MKSQDRVGEENRKGMRHSFDVKLTAGNDLLVVLCVVFVTAGILVLLPVLPMFTGGEEDHILWVMNMIQSIPSVWTYSSKVPFPLKHKHVLPIRGNGVMFQVAPFPSCPRVVFGKKRDWNIKVWPKVLCADAGLSQHGKADVKAKVFCVVWPGARV